MTFARYLPTTKYAYLISIISHELIGSSITSPSKKKKIGHDKSLLLNKPTVPTHINLRRFIKKYEGSIKVEIY